MEKLVTGELSEAASRRMRSFSQAYAGRRVVVTGHTGFKGSWLVSWLLDLGAEIYGFSNGLVSEPSLFALAGLAGRIRHETGDVRDVQALTRAIREFRPDYVFHLAAQAIVSLSYRDPLETISTNVMGTACVLQALREVEWPCVAVIITSDKAYENVEWSWGYRETDRLGGKDVYSGSKGAAELIFHAYLHSFFAGPTTPVRLATTRAGNVIGGGDWAVDRIVADCMRAWSQGDTVQIRSPTATRPWQHVLEPLSGYLMLGARVAEDASLNGESFNFGPLAEQNRTVAELLRGLAEVWGFEDSSTSFDVVGDVPFHEASLLKLNCDKALLALRWEPNLSYAECVGFTGEWYRRVLKDGADALDLTLKQIAAYQDLASQRGRVWAS